MSLSNYNDIIVEVADGIGMIKVCSRTNDFELANL